MKIIIMLIVYASSTIFAQERVATPRDKELYALAETNLKSFAEEVSKAADSELEKSQSVVKWLAEHFEWKATDYKKRTVQEIIERGGGNCNELAIVAVACFKELGITMRRVREINIHKEKPARGESAKQKVKEKGNNYSVFGRHHNDHVWLEIYDSKSGEWYPADPSIGIVGTNEWLAARAGFGKRYTLNPISEDMVVPFVVLAADGEGTFTVNRTRHYMVEGFNRLYDGRLEKLPAWKDWVKFLDKLQDNAEGAFKGEVNLHLYEQDIDLLAEAYSKLREQYFSK